MICAGCEPEPSQVAGIPGLVIEDPSDPSQSAASQDVAPTQDAGAPQVSALDLGDASSSTLTGRAWDSLGAKRYDQTIAYVSACLTRYQKQAIEMQQGLSEPVATSDPESVHAMWALNDVGTCYFIQGQALESQGETAEAMASYKALLDKVAFAQCWDPQGWFWKPADAATKQNQGT